MSKPLIVFRGDAIYYDKQLKTVEDISITNPEKNEIGLLLSVLERYKKVSGIQTIKNKYAL